MLRLMSRTEGHHDVGHKNVQAKSVDESAYQWMPFQGGHRAALPTNTAA